MSAQGRSKARAARWAAAAWFFLLLTAWTSMAGAGTAGRDLGVSASHIHTSGLYLAPNTSYVVETTNLSAGADTVLYVWDTIGNAFIAGNDDYSGSLRSRVTIAASPAGRFAKVIVRSYGSTSAGTATLLVTANGTPGAGLSISFTAGYQRALPNFGAGAHFTSVEEQGGTEDTIMLLTSGTATAIGFDDDTGVGLMSYIHAPAACSSGGCRVIVGSYGSPATPTTTLVWDEDVHNASLNWDYDGLSNTLEAVLGTQPANDDTDADNIDDGKEVLGIDDTNYALTRFPYMGSSPTQKDVFLQADWIECPNPLICSSVDAWRMPGYIAEGVAAFYAPDAVPDVRVHIDNGVTNTNPATRTIWGAWGGASRRTAAAVPKDTCANLGARSSYFHGARLETTGGGSTRMSDWCVGADADNAALLAHELGHNFNLDHGGLQSNSMNINCKPNYRSIMNYSVVYDDPTPHFSRNEYASAVLTPTAVSEEFGLDTTDPAKLAIVGFPSFQLTHNTAGAVDWNRDGLYNPGLVRAAVSWGINEAGGCDIGGFGYSTDENRGGYGSALSWLRYNPSSSPLYNNGNADVLFWFSRHESDGSIVYRTTSQSAINTGPNTTPTTWSPALTSSPNSVPGSPIATTEPAATSYEDTDGRNRLFLFTTASGSLHVQRFGAPASWTPTTALGAGAGDPAAVTYNGTVRAFVRAASGAGLLGYTFTPGTGWSSAVSQLWSDGSPIEISQGIGVTTGYVRTASGAALRMVALIPVASPAGQTEAALFDDATGRWERQDGTIFWPNGQPFTDARPSIAYEPFAAAEPTWGRFYIAWKSIAPPPDTPLYFISFTQGNDLTTGATARRMVANGLTTYIHNYWHTSVGSISLLFERGMDVNLRAAWTYNGGTYKHALFTKVGDQIIDGNLKDQDDFYVIRANLVCSLQGTACY